MEPYDLLMLLVLVGATLWGYWKGMAWQIASVASLVLSYFAALNFSPGFLQFMGWKEPWERFLAMFILYVASSFGIWFVFRQVRSGIDQIRMRDFDRQIGGIIGLAKGILLCLAITFFAVTLTAKSRDMVLKSKSGRYIALALNKSQGLMPRELDQVVGPYLRRLEHELNQPLGPSGPADFGATGFAERSQGAVWNQPAPNPTSFNPPASFNSPSEGGYNYAPTNGGEAGAWPPASGWLSNQGAPTNTNQAPNWPDPFGGSSTSQSLPAQGEGNMAPSPFEDLRTRLKAKLREKVDQTLNQAFEEKPSNR